MDTYGLSNRDTCRRTGTATPSFIALPTSAEVARPVQHDRAGHIQVTLQGKQVNLNIQWPLHDAQGCAMFIREVLR